MFHKRFGEILLETGLINEAQLEECLEEQKRTKEYLGDILLKKHMLCEEDFLKVLSNQFEIKYVFLKEQYIDWNICMKFSHFVNSTGKAFPYFENLASVTVAISDPLDVFLISEIEKEVAPKQLKLSLVGKNELGEFLCEFKERLRKSLKSSL